ncbi:MAG: putative selenium-dependent hydroxylase accessory protein YqeC [Gammaproteobacteria bacterium]|nr:putative selenium-dependent hydroxylase accessory protein YqeC [Gammaproteobacteria bacterium]NIR82454.1 putative selenium-dependent hydroxylase accessory protein YqeC [Gammaproteobacteria bacterium]NIR88450.1 putative selenium-dependent hydroxylase accessory protein YqeC [Gammaproteobacteria bacterium]NIU03590.1 putative selenium-dependent hydroxylase accessory protein YqeC [Gammaproteobacteria bacterium]NIV50942.1 putative selenium-dependent hydroxylase accessory protein YqeC [Gammaproteob
MSPAASQELLDALHARRGLVCLVGAGGKKTTLYRLAGIHPGRVGITSTVFIPMFPKSLEAEVVLAEEPQLEFAVASAAERSRAVAFAQPAQKRGRRAGLPPALVRPIHAAAGFEATLVKADGARSRLIKAPAEDEPQIPEDADTVIPVVSAAAFGEPLSERIAHRVEHIAAVSGAAPGAVMTASHVARLLSSEQGALRSVGTATVVPLINMIDDRERHALAREAALEALALTRRFDRVVLASMRAAEPLIEVLGR